MSTSIARFVFVGLCTGPAVALGAERIARVPEIFSRVPGHYADGKFGQALWLHSASHGLGYPLSFGRAKVEQATVASWFRTTRQRWDYDYMHVLELTDGVQTLSVEIHSGHPKPEGFRPRSLWVAAYGVKNRPRRWYHATKRLPADFHERFHHLVFTWRRGESHAYLDGKRIGGTSPDKSGTWLAPFAGNSMKLLLKGVAVWYDDIIVSDRYVTGAEAGRLARRGARPALDDSMPLHLPFDGSLDGQTCIPADGRGVAFAPYAEVTDNHFLARDPARFYLRLVNYDAQRRAVCVRATVENLRKKVVCQLSKRLLLGPRSVLVEPADLRLKERGLFWGDFWVEDDSGRTLARERAPFAVTLGPDVNRYAAVDIPNGMVISQGSHPAPGEKWSGFESWSPWRNLEYEPGKWDFSALDNLVDEAIETGREPHLMFVGPPDWQSTGPPPPAPFQKRYWAAPRNNGAWVDYVRRLARRYKGKVRTYEVWNEPYWNDPTAGYFYGSAGRYVELVRLAADAVHAIDPQARVVAGVGGPRSWWEKISKATAGKADLYSTHPYNTAKNFDSDESTMLDILKVLRANGAAARLTNTEVSDLQLAQHGVYPDGRPMSAAEFDASGRWRKMSDAWRNRGHDALHDHFTSAAMLVRSHTLSLAGGCEYILWWTYRPGMPGTTFAPNTPSLQSVAYANFAGLIAGFRYVRRIDLGAAYLKAYMFEDKQSKRLLLIAWADREPEVVHLELGPGPLEVLDVFGNSYPFERTGPLVALKLNMSPVYVRGFTRAPMASVPVMAALVEPEASHTCVFPGEKATLSVRVYNPLAKPLRGELRVSLPSGFNSISPANVTLEPRGKATHRFTIAVPDDVAGGQPIVVTLTTGAAMLGKITRKAILPVRLRAEARMATVSPIIDGDLSDWGSVDEFPIRIAKGRQIAVGAAFTARAYDPKLVTWHGPSDLSLAAAIRYDRDNVYLAIRVWDNAIVNRRVIKRPALAYEGDCVEVFVDAHKPPEQGKRVYGDGVFHLMLTPPLKDFPAPTLRVSQPRGGRLKAVALDSKLLPDGYAIEMRIPASNFPPVTFTPGATIGFDLAVDDSDDPAVPRRKTQMVWAGDATDYKDPSVFGRLIFGSQ